MLLNGTTSRTPWPCAGCKRHLLANPAALFSVQKFYDSLRSQGVPIGKDNLHAFLGYLEGYLPHPHGLSIHTASERQRMVNPRKAYPVEPGVDSVYERTGRPTSAIPWKRPY